MIQILRWVGEHLVEPLEELGREDLCVEEQGSVRAETEGRYVTSYSHSWRISFWQYDRM